MPIRRVTTPENGKHSEGRAKHAADRATETSDGKMHVWCGVNVTCGDKLDQAYTTLYLLLLLTYLPEYHLFT